MVEVRTGFTDCDVEVHSDVGGSGEPDHGGREADRVVPGIVRGEGEPTGGWTSGVH